MLYDDWTSSDPQLQSGFYAVPYESGDDAVVRSMGFVTSHFDTTSVVRYITKVNDAAPPYSSGRGKKSFMQSKSALARSLLPLLELCCIRLDYRLRCFQTLLVRPWGLEHLLSDHPK